MNFRYLDELIHNGALEVVLDCDIAFDDGQEYSDGIMVDVDGLVINGNGHTIDARGKAGIFKCIGKGIIMKDLTFKNAFLFDNCCAIHNTGELVLINCRFIGNANESNVWGGAIFNDGEMAVEKCSFEENSTSNEGGAIKNYGRLTISQSVFMRNSACDGGAIFNFRRGNLKLVDSTFIANEASSSTGNDIVNRGKIAVQDCVEFSLNGIANEGFIIASQDILDTVSNSGTMAELNGILTWRISGIVLPPLVLTDVVVDHIAEGLPEAALELGDLAGLGVVDVRADQREDKDQIKKDVQHGLFSFSWM